MGVEPGPTVGDGFGSDGFAGVDVGDGDGFGSDGSTGVGVIFGSTVGDGVGVANRSRVGVGVIAGVVVGFGVALYVVSFETVVAMIPEIRNKSVVIDNVVFFKILPPLNSLFQFQGMRFRFFGMYDGAHSLFV